MESWVVPVVTALVSTVGAFVSVWYARRAATSERREEADELASRFREPLLQAVFNLETRIYNIVELDFFGRFLAAGSAPEEREYAELNTAYVFGQYFCWIEIIRRESQFTDPRHVERNRALAESLEAVRDTFADSVRIGERAFRLFRGEQRAMGELMLVAVEADGGAPRWECLGYAAFVRRLEEPAFARWFSATRSDVLAGGDAGVPRLRLVQNRLVDILDLLDPEVLRVPGRFRKRLSHP